MGSLWQSTMEEYGVSAAADSQVALSPDALNGDSPIQVDLSHLRVIKVTGGDAAEFLQGQFCNDLGAVSTDQAQLSGYCTPKGRLLALPIVVAIESGFLLLVPEIISEAFVKRLTMFVMRADVTLELKDECLCTGIISDSAGGWGEVGVPDLDLADSPLSTAIMDSTTDSMTVSTTRVISWPPIELAGRLRRRRLLIAPQAQQLAMWQKQAALPKASASVWRLGDIQQGVPSVSTATSDTFVPQMVNLQLIDALSFKKGCYPGQEIVARMQYLGKLKRHMRRFTLSLADAAADSSVPSAGDSLVNGDDDNAGVVVDAVINDDLVELLAVVKISADAEAFTFAEARLETIDLPYDLPSLADSVTDTKGKAS